MDEEIRLYTGMEMADRKIISKYQKQLNQTVNIPGYTSIVFRGEDQVLDETINSANGNKDTQRVLFEIVFPKGGHCGFCFKLEQAEHTIYA